MIFEVTPEHIEQLGDSDLRTLVGMLAEREAVRQGHSAASVTFGGHQNAPDGGIDVRVDLGLGEVTGYIARGRTGFQVKAEDLPRAGILKEMRPGGTLRSSIIDLAKKNGAYIIVSSQGSVADTALIGRRNAMLEAIDDIAERDQLYVDFYDRRRLASWVNQNASLIPWVRERVGQSLSGWQPFADWSSSPGAVDDDYLTDEHVRLRRTALTDSEGSGIVAGIERLRTILSEPKGAIRLVGLSGVGKTRLVQALFDARIGAAALERSLAIYTDLADDPDPVPLELLSGLQSLGSPCILIVDNCGFELHRKMVARMKQSSAPISLVTVEYDISDDAPENTDVFKLEPASDTTIEQVLEKRHPNLSPPEIRTIASFSEGNFRVALALAETARAGESLANLNDSELFKRLFRQRNEDNPALLKAASVCALVYSFDGETLEENEAELPVLAALAGQTVSELYGHVAELHRRQLVQKRARWRAVLPHALAHRLARLALQNTPLPEIIAAFTHSAPERLLKSFSRRLGYLHDVAEAQKIVAEWLSEGGWLGPISDLNALGQTLLNNIAPVNPRAVLDGIERAANSGALADINSNRRREMASLLRALAYDAGNFERAMGVLIPLALTTEPSNNTGDADKVFTSMFTIYLSGTQASPEQRAKLILKLAQSGDEQQAKLALAALDSMLEVSHFSSHYGFEFGARKRDYGFHPNSSDDYALWFGTAFSLCQDMAALPQLRSKARQMFASQFGFLAYRTGMTGEMIALAEHFMSDGGWPEGWAGVRSALRLLKDEKRKDETQKLATLANRLQPSSLAERIAVYVQPKSWSVLDVVDLDLEDDNKHKAARAKAEQICAEIGAELATDMSLLEQYLPALIEAESYWVVTVMTVIGRKTSDAEAAWKLLRTAWLSAEGPRGYVLPGLFINGLAKKDRDAAETILEDAFQDEAFHPIFVHMQVNAGLNDRGIERLLAAAALETFPTESFRNLGYGPNWRERPGEDLAQVLRALAARPDGLDVAMDILQSEIHHARESKLPIDQPVRNAGKELLAQYRFSKDHNRNHPGYGLAQIVKGCFDPETDEALAREICTAFHEAVASYDVYPGDYREFMSALGSRFPRAVLDIFVEDALENPDASYRFSFARLGRINPMGKIDHETALEWAREKPDIRYLALAAVAPLWDKATGGEGPGEELEDASATLGWTPIAIAVVKEAADPIPVLEIFVKRFHPGGWSGSLAALLESRAPLLETLTNDSDGAISAWAKQALEDFRGYIEKQRKWESEHDRERDERFEW